MTADSKKARTIVVTGGADGIGRAVILLCAAHGDNIVVLDKNAEAAKAAAEEAMKRGAKSGLSFSYDVLYEEQIEQAFELIWNKIGAPMDCSPVQALISEGAVEKYTGQRFDGP